jgi:hypothetical protein
MQAGDGAVMGEMGQSRGGGRPAWVEVGRLLAVEGTKGGVSYQPVSVAVNFKKITTSAPNFVTKAGQGSHTLHALIKQATAIRRQGDELIMWFIVIQTRLI